MFLNIFWWTQALAYPGYDLGVELLTQRVSICLALLTIAQQSSKFIMYSLPLHPQ